MHEVLEVVTASETERGWWLSGVREAGSGSYCLTVMGCQCHKTRGVTGLGGVTAAQ